MQGLRSSWGMRTALLFAWLCAAVTFSPSSPAFAPSRLARLSSCINHNNLCSSSRTPSVRTLAARRRAMAPSCTMTKASLAAAFIHQSASKSVKSVIAAWPEVLAVQGWTVLVQEMAFSACGCAVLCCHVCRHTCCRKMSLLLLNGYKCAFDILWFQCEWICCSVLSECACVHFCFCLPCF